ncbi:hypothetical protein [Chitinophaga sp. MM2321]|uniref:hypothetical protein n=1 Tax=Chitinophaga sp. MM2321 TaxID=3137178 RepID=UPI0032D57FF1
MNRTQRFHDLGTQAVLLQKRSMLVFKTISMLLPFLLIVGIELILRAFNYGYDLRLFITSPQDKNYYVLNPDASRRYFSNQQIATTGNSEIFKKIKDKNTLRVFVLGESTTIGYPYFHNGSFHRCLQYRLMHTCPDKELEIINLSLTAVNSYTVAGFAKELVHYQPDAVLIYTGHNEYYGCLGAGSTDKIAGNPFIIHTILKLREFRLTQLFANVLDKITSPGRAAGPESGKARMELMVAEQQIPYGSVLYERGIRQFSTNMDQTLQLLNGAHVPVFISNLVSSEKDLFPFISMPVDSVSYPGFAAAYTRAEQLLQRGDSLAALSGFLAANNIYGAHAGCNYYLGLLKMHQGDNTAAKVYFSKARDLDALRFRAPSKLNEIILQLCRKYKNTHLVDAHAAFEAATSSHIIGKELVLEHVHPNLKGYALLSDVFYNAMKQQGIFTVQPENEMSFAQLQQAMPITVVDSLAGAYKIANLKRSWPFNTGHATDTTLIATPEEQLAYEVAFRHTSWATAMQQLYDSYNRSGQLAAARTVVEALALEHPTDPGYYEQAANYFGKLNDFDNALVYFKKAFALAPSFDNARNLFVLCLKLDRSKAALPYLDYAIAHNEQQLDLQPVKTYLLQVLQLQEEAARQPLNVTVLNQIAAKYYRMGNKDGAALYVEKVLHTAPADKDALLLQSQLKKI